MVIKSPKHNPFLRRRQIVILAIVTSFVAFFAGLKIDYVPVAYILAAISFDQLLRQVKEIPINEQILQEQERVSFEDLQRYLRSKRIYRLYAACFAAVIGIIAYLRGYKFALIFALSYGAAWIIHPAIRKFILKIPTPASQVFKWTPYNFMRHNIYFQVTITEYLRRRNDAFTVGTPEYTRRLLELINHRPHL